MKDKNDLNGVSKAVKQAKKNHNNKKMNKEQKVVKKYISKLSL